jgi:parvulin-like peptidyl-prolyl isomerase
MSSNPPTPSGTRRVRSALESRSASVRAAAAAPSRRQRSHWQREQHQLHLLYIAIGVLAAGIVAIFLAGFVYDNVVQANQVVAQIGPDTITAQQLLDEVRPQARAIDNQAKQLGDPSTTASYVDQQKRSLPNSVLNNLVDTHIITQEAARRGVSVSSADVDDKVRQTVASFNASTNPTPSPDATDAADAQASSTPDAQTSATPSATAPTTPTPVPTLDDASYGTALQKLLDQNSLTESDLRTILQRGLVRDRVSAAIGEQQVPASQPQVHARQILVPTSDQANDLLNQLQNSADFATLAQQNSTDTATKAAGGDMGWFNKGVQTKAIDDAVFALQPGQLSSVVNDTAGYHILQVLESDPNRALPQDQLLQQRQKAFNDWLSAQRNSQDVKLSLDQAKTNWVLSKIGVRP